MYRIMSLCYLYYYDISIMLYTSGTTGRPKGVLLSYYNIISVTSVACELENTSFNDEVVAYLPMAWVGDNIFCVARAYARNRTCAPKL